jgi:penicillin-binding protein 2
MSNLLVPRSDVSEFRKRYRWMALAALLGFCAVIVRLFQLQVINGAQYAQTAHENVIRKVTIPTTRGIVRDAQGRILASSRPSFNVLLVPGRVMPSARPRYRVKPTDEPDSLTPTSALGSRRESRTRARPTKIARRAGAPSSCAKTSRATSLPS